MGALQTNRTRQYMPLSPSDGSATAATVDLFRKLINGGPNVLNGCCEQFSGQNVRVGIPAELKAISGEVPAILAWEIYTQQTAAANKAAMLSDLNAHMSAGGIVGLHDHPGNPVTSTLFDTGYTGAGTGYADRSGSPVAAIKSGGAKNADYLSYLDEVASIISAINGPVLYRPFHEINGNWFWWNGSDRRADMILVWQQTVNYLRTTKGLHNVLFVLNFDANGDLSDAAYGGQALSMWWPGAAYVDVISLDYYPSGSPATLDTARFKAAYGEVVALAAQYGRPIGISEYGAQSGVAQTQSDFWWWSFGVPLLAKYPEIRFFCTWNGAYAPSVSGASADSYKTLSAAAVSLPRISIL